MAWRSNVDGIDTWGGIDILFHSAAGRIEEIRPYAAPTNAAILAFSGRQELHLTRGCLRPLACVHTHSALVPNLLIEGPIAMKKRISRPGTLEHAGFCGASRMEHHEESAE